MLLIIRMQPALGFRSMILLIKRSLKVEQCFYLMVKISNPEWLYHIAYRPDVLNVARVCRLPTNPSQ